MAPTASPAKVVVSSSRRVEHETGQDRLGRPARGEHERRQQYAARAERREARRRVPLPRLPTAEDRQHQQRQPQRQQYRARIVDGSRPAVGVLVEAPQHHPRRKKAKRHVEHEDAAPDTHFGEQPAEGRADHRCDGPHAGDVPLHFRPLGERVDVGDDCDRHRLHRTGTDPLHRAGDDQRGHRPRRRTEDRAEKENADACQDHRLAAVHVGELRVERRRHSLREQIAREQPGKQREVAEFADDRRHRRGQHRRIKGDQAEAEHDRDEDWTSLGPKPHVDGFGTH